MAGSNRLAFTFKSCQVMPLSVISSGSSGYGGNYITSGMTIGGLSSSSDYTAREYKTPNILTIDYKGKKYYYNYDKEKWSRSGNRGPVDLDSVKEKNVIKVLDKILKDLTIVIAAQELDDGLGDGGDDDEESV